METKTSKYYMEELEKDTEKEIGSKNCHNCNLKKTTIRKRIINFLGEHEGAETMVCENKYCAMYINLQNTDSWKKVK